MSRAEKIPLHAALDRVARGVVLVCISQIDRRYDPAQHPLPGLGDVRLPNPVDLRLFSKACFLQDGEVELAAVS